LCFHRVRGDRARARVERFREARKQEIEALREAGLRYRAAWAA
jgi:hypothetical protein